MTIQIIPFDENLLPQAAALLAERHRRDRIALPHLPRRFGEIDAARQAIDVVWAKPHAAGFAAIEGGRLSAFLLGDRVIDAQRGRSGWVRNAGYAYSAGVDPDVIRDLYAALGESWVANGVFAHYALISVADAELLHAWYSLSFGIEQVHALLDLAKIGEAGTSIPGIDLRCAASGDEPHLAVLSDVIWREQVKTPVWGAMMPESVSEVEKGWAGLATDADCTTWLAMEGDAPVGVQVYWPAEAGNDALHVDDDCLHLGVAGTRVAQRGRGIGTWMTQTGLAWAAANGYRCCETDWRSTNLMSSRFWPRRGFRPAVYRLVRQVDARIAWAAGV
jgi:GNAT superfamily N-acetyltransferase